MNTFHSLISSAATKYSKPAMDVIHVHKRNVDTPSPILLNEKRNNSIIMTLNNPRYLNAASSEMLRAMASSLKEFEKNSNNIDLLFLKGSGKALSAGGDIKVFVDAIKDPKKVHVLDEYLDNAYKALYRYQTSRIPTISFMNGLTAGYGGGLSFCTKFRVATENTVHMMPETRIGHFCDAASSYHLSRLGGNYGTYLALTAERSKAEDLIDSGIATHFIPSERLDAVVEHLTSLNSSNLHLINQELSRFAEMLPSVERLTTNKAISQREKHQIIANCFKFNTVHEIISALEKEGSSFSLTTREKIILGSPTAAKITLELLRRASTLSFLDCILLERRLWSFELGSHDFAEGCISMLAKKSPKWNSQHANTLELKDDIHASHFGRVESIIPMNLLG